MANGAGSDIVDYLIERGGLMIGTLCWCFGIWAIEVKREEKWSWELGRFRGTLCAQQLRRLLNLLHRTATIQQSTIFAKHFR
jgi:hypothetical protein